MILWVYNLMTILPPQGMIKYDTSTSSKIMEYISLRVVFMERKDTNTGHSDFEIVISYQGQTN